MGKECIAFRFQDAKEARRHMDYDIVKDYGGYAYGHPLYCWDDGKRYLARCRKCGGYILIQQSEFHGIQDNDYYADYFPVGGAQEAEEWNRMYDGFAIEAHFEKRYLMMTNLCLHWSG